MQSKLTTCGWRPVDVETLVGTLQLLRDQLQRKNLLVDVNVRPAHINAHFTVVFLVQQAVCDNRRQIFSGFTAVPTTLVVASSRHVIADRLRQLCPEPSSVSDCVTDFTDQRFESSVFEVRCRLVRRLGRWLWRGVAIVVVVAVRRRLRVGRVAVIGLQWKLYLIIKTSSARRLSI